jgi:DNA-binding beta-propeller fold protein YncE
MVLAAVMGLLACAPAARADSVYVTNDDGVFQFDTGAGGALTAKPAGTVAAGTNPGAIAVSPDGRSVYVANNGSGNVSQYDVADDGALTAKSPATVAAGANPIGIAVSPDGTNVYVTSASDSSISQYTVGAGGALVPKTPAAVANGSPGFGIVVSPDGKSVYVASQPAFNGTVSQYDVGAGGHLTAKSPATVPAGISPVGVAVNPDGSSVYVANGGGDNISQYDVGAGGTLSAKSQPTVAAGQSPYGMAASRDGTSFYVTNQGANRALGGNSVSQYDVAPGGRLTAKAPASVPAGEQPRGVAISTGGGNVYAPNFGDANIGQFDVGPGGSLAAKSPAVVGAGPGPDGVAVSQFGGLAPTEPTRPPPEPPLVTLIELTEITSGPSGLVAEPPAFTFISPRLGASATFECRFDSREFRPCTSPHTGYNLSRGQHTFEVRALDGAGTPDPTPASRSFRLGRITTRETCTVNIDWDRYPGGIGRPPQSCVALRRQCPEGSLCTLEGTVDIDHEDGAVWRGETKIGIEGPNRDLVSRPTVNSGIPCYSPSRDVFECPATTAGLSFYGRDDIVTVTCTVTEGALIRRGPDDARILTCKGRLTMDYAPSLSVRASSGLSSAVFLPGAGTLTITGTTTGNARAAGKRRRTAIKTTRIRATTPAARKFKLRPTAAAMRTYKRKRALKLALRLTFVGADGTRTTKRQKLTVKQPRPVPRLPRPRRP